MADQHPGADLMLDLALTDLDQTGRDELTGHLALCDPCRAAYTAIADSVDHILAAAPSVDPPAGFSRSVLTAMGMTGPAAGGEGWPPTGLAASAPARHRRLRPRPIVVATLAAMIALLAGVAGAVAVMDARQGPAAEAAAAGPALLTRDGARVGTVLDTWYDGQPVLAVTLTAGTVGVRYECRLLLADGTREAAGSWVLRQPSGTTWLLDRPDAQVTGLELVTDAGVTWATAHL